MTPLRWSRPTRSAHSPAERRTASPALPSKHTKRPFATATSVAQTTTPGARPHHQLNSNAQTCSGGHRHNMAPKQPTEPATYYLLPNLRALDTSACEVDLNAHSWVQPIIIDDDDLTFGGKSLSEWYEEDRSRLSTGGSDDGHGHDDSRASSHSHHHHHLHHHRQSPSHGEERRGRERVRRNYSPASDKAHRK